jgi:hypothetical protein
LSRSPNRSAIPFQPPAGLHCREAGGDDGAHRAFGVAVLTATRAGIARLVVFGDPGLVTRSGCPPVLPAATPAPPPAR